MGPSLRVADGFTQLVTHALAHVALDQPGNLHDPRYVAWARAQGIDGQEQLEHDAAVLARCWRADPSLDLLHGFCELHVGLDAFRRTAARPLAALERGEVRDPELLCAIRGLPAAELLHAALGLLSDGFARSLAELGPELERDCGLLRPYLRRLAAVPGLAAFADARVELVWALGVHGRALPERILVGAPAAWNACSPARQAVLGAHEHLVADVASGDYFEAEWQALTRLARALRDHGDDELRDAHARWLTSIDLSELLAELVRRRRIPLAAADTIESARADGLARFADLGPGPQ